MLALVYNVVNVNL